MFVALGDAFAVFGLLGFLTVEAVSDGDVTPLEVVSDGHCVVTFLGAGHSEEENTAGYKSRELEKEE